MFFKRKITGIECVTEDTLKIIADLKGGLQITDYATLSGAVEGYGGLGLHDIKTPDDNIYVKGFRRFRTLPEHTGLSMAAYCSKNKTTYLFLHVQQLVVLFKDGKYIEEKTPYSRILTMYDLKKFIYQDSRNILEKFGETY